MNDNNTSGSFRPKKVNFTQVSNSALRDTKLSLKAKGLYSLIQSYITIPNFILHKSYLMNICIEGEKAFDSGWKELKDNGYLKQYRIPKGERGAFVYEYDLLDVPDVSTPSLVDLNRKGEEKTTEISQSDHTPHLAPYAQSTLCKEHPMLNGGNINNTDFNNIDTNNIENPINIKSVLESKQEEQKKTDEIGADTIAQIKSVKNEKESFQNATIASDKHLKPSNPIRYEYNTTKEIIQDNIGYSYMIGNPRIDGELLDDIVEIIVNTILTEYTDNYIYMGTKENRVKVYAEVVRSTFFKLTNEHIQYTMHCFKQQTTPIRKFEAYIRNSLFSNFKTSNLHTQNMISVDFPEQINR